MTERILILGIVVSVLLCNLSMIRQGVHEEHIETDPVDFFSDDEIDLMARVVQAEAGNQDEKGMRLVAACILNRMEADGFPDTVAGVVWQENQFAVHRTFSLAAMDAVYAEIRERTDTHVLWFRTWTYHDYGRPLYKYGDHYFSGE